ncbi:hypothetical protein D9M68_820150 [compost metagenome]
MTLHGPHQGAQKSTSTGVCIEASMTSVSKLAMVTLIMAMALEMGPRWAVRGRET